MSNNVIYAYIKNNNNEVVYIGRTNNLERRRREHEEKEPFQKNRPHYDYPLSRGIRKYGIKYYRCEVIEENLSLEESKIREKYWIQYYDTYNDPSKYNQTPGGEIVTDYKFEDEIVDIVKKMLESNIDYNTISKETGVSISHISEINTGKRRKDEFHTYPINEMTNGKKLNKAQLQEIIDLLKQNKLTNQQIGLLYSVNEYTIQSINIGRTYHQDSIEYPIRKRCQTKKRKILNEEDFNLLINDLINTLQPFTELATKYGVSTSTIYNINKGKTRKQESLNYPLRK